MKTVNLFVHMLELSRSLIAKSVSDLSSEQWFYKLEEEVACAAWIIGHAVMIDRQLLDEVANHLEGSDLSLPSLRDGWSAQFSNNYESASEFISFDEHDIYKEFVDHRRLLIEALTQLPDSALDREVADQVSPNPLSRDGDDMLFEYQTLDDMVTKSCLYMYQLVGEISIVRCSLGLREIDDEFF